MTSGNSAFVKFKTDESREWSGFVIQYNAIVDENLPCLQTNVISGRNDGAIRSFTCQADGLYRNNEDCKWRIFAESSKVIRMKLDFLDIQYCPNCSCDSLAIYDGNKENDTNLIKRYCGTEWDPDEPIVTSTSDALVRFQTDASIQGRGFTLNYTAESRTDNTPCTGYNYVANQMSGTISNYRRDADGLYRGDESCSWWILAPTDNDHYFVKLTIREIDIQECDECSCDALSIFEYPWNFKGLFCGNKVPKENVFYSEAKLFVHFASDRKIEQSGFVADFESKFHNINQISLKN